MSSVSLSSLNNIETCFIAIARFVFPFLTCAPLYINSQVQPINYVSNGGFEIVDSPSQPFYSARFWGSTDTNKYYGELLSANTTPVKVPLSSYTFQWPRGGNNHLISLQYCSTCPNNKRGYPRNRLKQKLKANTVYCFSMFVNLSNQSTHAIESIGAYFSDSSSDTITKCNVPIDYLSPQVENTNGIISDTLNWTLIRGSFTANGNEKYLLIGNFRSDANTNNVLVNPTNLPANAADYLIDDVSCIELNLPAFAGRDTTFIPGDSVFLGREPDVGIDEACVWYKFPSTTPIDTVAGFWIKPTEACTYVVRQEICGLVKWDTVRITIRPVGLTIDDLLLTIDGIRFWPNPANDKIEIELSGAHQKVSSAKCSVFDQLGRTMLQKKIVFENGSSELDTRELEEGVYFIELKNEKGVVGRKRIFIVR